MSSAGAFDRDMFNLQSIAATPRAGPALSADLLDARDHTLSIYAHLNDAQCRFPRLATINPAWWELGHIGWFQEFWCRRYRADDIRGTARPSVLDGADQQFDSSTIPHARRFELPLTREVVLAYLARTLETTIEGVRIDDGSRRYFHELALGHEDMHGEALLMTLQTLGLPAPAGGTCAALLEATSCVGVGGDIGFPGGRYVQGTPDDAEHPHFAWDNEKCAHEVVVKPFSMAQRRVTNAEFAAFVADGGYARPELWSDAGWVSRNRRGLAHPAYWRAEGTTWRMRHFDQWFDAAPDAPVVHVNAHEAEAYCRWAGRRLPSETEFEYAAVVAPQTFAALLWEWTASAFLPYPEFRAGPYADYSAPWFGDHRVVRGGSFASRARLLHPRLRNFYLPERHDIFVGFRTCA